VIGVNPAAPSATLTFPTPAPTLAPASGRKKKATTPKKEMMPAERVIETKKRI
jgi:hypothetical protein